jgi:hypothetical protein
MKRIVLTAGLVTMFLMLSLFPAQAALVQSDIYDPDDNYTSEDGYRGTKIKPSNLSYPELEFTLTLQGYTTGTALTDAWLVLDLGDEASFSSVPGALLTIKLTSAASETREFLVDGARTEYEIDISDANILTALMDSGFLDFTIGISTNPDLGSSEPEPVDFMFYDAQMSAETVPIPSAFLLLGTGVAGLVGIRRRLNK